MSAAPIHPGPFEGAPPLTPAEVKAIVAACFADTNNALSTNPDGTITITSPLTGDSVTTSPHPELTAGDGIEIADGVITATVLDTDTDTRTVCTFALVAGVLRKTTTVTDVATGDPVGNPVVETIPLPTVPKYNACDIDGNVTSPAPDDTTFLTDAIVKRECVNNNLEMETTTKGGVVQKEVWRPVKVRQSVNSSLITAATAVGELYHPDICQFVPASSCGGTVDLVGYNSVNGNGPSDGFLTLRHFASTTGGAVYSPIFTGGVSEQQLLSDGETHPTNVFFSTLPPGGALICYRTTVFANSITAGRADVATQSAYFTHMECRTC